ncbi:MAG: outer membrane beta-barrel protein [Terracidiphilus sp.]
MRLKLCICITLALLLVCAAYPVFAQATPAATGPKAYSPWAAGVGFSGYNPDFGHGHLLGGTLWVDYTPSKVPQMLRGIGLEVEARDLSFGRSSEFVDLRQDVAGGGLIYSWRRFSTVRPYAKLLMGFGNADYPVPNIPRYHQTRTITALGGGVDFRAFRQLWVRADYEYQFWPDFYFEGGKPIAQLNPAGFTVGALYHFSRPHFR